MKSTVRPVCVLLAALLLFSACASAPEPEPAPIVLPGAGETVRLAVATDLHLISPSIVKEGEPFRLSYAFGDGKQINYISEITDAFLAQVIAEKPHALVLTGDLTLDGEKKSHEDLAKRLRLVRNAGIQVLVIPGNHDINNAYASGFKKDKKYTVDGVTPEEFAAIYADCGYDGALYRDETTLSYVYALSPDLWMVMLDTSKYHDRGGMNLSLTGGEVPAETMLWLEGCLKAAGEAGVRVVSATHHNLMNHSPRIRENYTLDNDGELLALYDRYGVTLNLSGHIHMQSISSAKTENHEIFDIVTSSLSVYTNQYGRLDITPGGAASYRSVEVDVEGWAAAKGSKDENLLNFEEYSYGFFYDLTYEKFVYNLFMDQVPYEDAEILAKTVAILNPAYFSGKAAEVRDEVLASDHYALWQREGWMFSRDYVSSMLLETEYDPRQVEIPWP